MKFKIKESLEEPVKTWLLITDTKDAVTVSYRKRTKDFSINTTNPNWVVGDCRLRFMTEEDANRFAQFFIEQGGAKECKVSPSKTLREVVKIKRASVYNTPCPEDIPLYVSINYFTYKGITKDSLNEASTVRYTPKKYGAYWWGIIDHNLNNGLGLMIRAGENPNYTAPLDNNDNKLLLFKSKDQAQQKCDELNNNSLADTENIQYGVHQFSTESIIFRGTEEECQNYINERPELWDDAEVYFMTPDDPHYQKNESLEESIYTYQTWIRPIEGEKQPSKTLTYGSDVILTRSPYSKEVFGRDWKRHIAKIIEWCIDNNPGLIRLTHDFRLNNFNDPNSNEAFIAAIEDKINKGEYLLQHSLTEDTKYYPHDYDKIDLEYDNLKFTQFGNQRDVDDWDEWDRETSWTYEVDKKDLYTYIFESCITEEDFPAAFENDFDSNNEEDWKLFTSWLDDNFNDIYSKYEDKILEQYEDAAIEDAQANYDPDDYVDWDSMPGGHDDYRFDESINEGENMKFKITEEFNSLDIDAEPELLKALKQAQLENPHSWNLTDRDKRVLSRFAKWARIGTEAYKAMTLENWSDLASMLINEFHDPRDLALLFRVFDQTGKVSLMDYVNMERYFDMFHGSERDWAITEFERRGLNIPDNLKSSDDINESKDSKICCICKKPFEGYGNNAEPVCSGTCCDECNMKEVIPARLKTLDESTSESMRKAIDAAFSTTDITSEVQEILKNNNANEDDSDPELGYFKGMSDEDIENAYSEVKDLIISKYTSRTIPDYLLKAFSFDYIEANLNESLNESYYQLSKDDFTVHYLGQDENLWDDLIDNDDDDELDKYRVGWFEKPGYYHVTGGGDSYIDNEWVNSLQEFNELCFGDEYFEESLNEGNSVSGKVPPALDSFLQDIAQMYQTIDYGDIMDHDYTADDIRKLNNLRRRFITWAQYDEDDEEVKAKFNEIANKVAEILKRVDEGMNEGFDDDTDFDIDESAEYNFMEALYKGSDFNDHDDEALNEEFGDDSDYITFYYDEDRKLYIGSGDIVTGSGNTLKAAVEACKADAENYDSSMYSGVEFNESNIDWNEEDPEELGYMDVTWVENTDDYDDDEYNEDDDLNLLETNKGSIEVFDWDFSNIYDNEIMIETDLGTSTIEVNIEDLDSLLPNKKIFATDEHYTDNNTGIKWVKLTECQIEFIKEAIEENLEDDNYNDEI